MKSNTKLTFEQKVKSMTAKEIILTMVDSLTPPPTVNVDMNTFGRVEDKIVNILGIRLKTKRRCFGCAATNTICKIADISPFEYLNPANLRGTEYNINHMSNRTTYETTTISRADNLKVDCNFLTDFERAIDSLRKGCLADYNDYAKMHGFAVIHNNKRLPLCYLSNNYCSLDLDRFRNLANSQ